MKNKKSVILGIVLVVILIGGTVIVMKAGNKKSSTTMDTSATNAVATNKVLIQNYMFNPMTIKVKVGTTVTWTNQDAVHHSVTADTISTHAPNGPLIGQSQDYSFTFTQPGTYTFHCTPHPYMHGTVIVSN